LTYIASHTHAATIGHTGLIEMKSFNVRFAPESGLKSDIATCPLSAISGHRRWRDSARELRAKLSAQGDQNGVLEYNKAQHPADGAALATEALMLGRDGAPIRAEASMRKPNLSKLEKIVAPC
jgi:hypothetical protein